MTKQRIRINLALRDRTIPLDGEHAAVIVQIMSLVDAESLAESQRRFLANLALTMARVMFLVNQDFDDTRYRAVVDWAEGIERTGQDTTPQAPQVNLEAGAVVVQMQPGAVSTPVNIDVNLPEKQGTRLLYDGNRVVGTEPVDAA